MSYQVLARKWRPRTFREMVGQQHVLQALINALDHNRLHHAYLFTGTRGVGKTTIARILAKCLNCETGVSSEPCGQCSACVEINDGRFVDLIEVDAASRTKVEDTRELLENVQYAPTRGRYKVYLIDEVHMLSSHSFNALLKTLEEPPPHVKFLLATTDPQKLPVTILSRCLQFHLKNMNPERIVEHLKYVLEQEMVPFEEAALWQLGRAADGSMRDAMSLTDQAIAFGSGKVADGEVSAMLGTIDQSLVYDLLGALASHQGGEVLAAVERLSQHAPDYAAALAELLSVLHRIAIAQTLPEAVDNSRGDRDRVLDLAQLLPAEDIQLFYQTALLGRRDLPLAPDPRGGFEMVLLRMLAFKPQGVREVPTQALPAQQAVSAPQAVAAAVPAAPVAESVSQAEQAQPDAAPSANPAPQPEPQDTPPWQEPADETAVADIQPQNPTQQVPPVKKPEAPPQAVSAGPSAALAVLDGNAAPVMDVSAAAPAAQPMNQPSPMAEAVLNAPVAEPAALAEVETIRSPEVTSPEPAAVAVEYDQTVAPANEVAQPEPVPDIEKVSFDQVGPDTWIPVYLGLGVGGVLQSTVSNCLLVGREGNTLHFLLDQNNSMLYDESHQQRLSEMLSNYFGQPVQALISQGAVDRETPAAYAIRLKAERQAQALNAMQTDPLVQQLLQHFDAILQTDTVVPIDN
ncbi:DNA polymerase III subunit gamma/tau [Maricurvus nonylphenolicus]|uniref:DNA polymerase III subunit gamma/tau n=1 Tax=Maricurvus nonylphenolicus TaxID=1008307 RepID=UPI0036F215C0